MVRLVSTPCSTGAPATTVRMWLPAVLSSSSQVRKSAPFGPNAFRTGGRLLESQVSAFAVAQPAVLLLCELSQLLGMMKTRLGSVWAAMSAARSGYGRSLVWSRFEKLVQGSCFRVYSPLEELPS